MKICPQCNVTFKERRKSSKFCSHECSSEYQRQRTFKKTNACLQCSAETANKQFCSRSCAATYTNLRRQYKQASPDILEERRQKQNLKRRIHRKLSAHKEDSCKIYHNVCQKTGKIFIYPTYLKFHPSLANDRTEYATSCRFRFALSSFPLWFDCSIIKEHGMYSTPGSNKSGTLNTNGVSRDHMISVTYGWINKIDPRIISHPANCQLLLHRQNQRKMTKCSITLDELQTRIDAFEELYPNWRTEEVSNPLRVG